MALWFLFAFCHKVGIICISEVIDISPSNLDSSFCPFGLAFSMTYSAYKLNKQDDNTQPWHTPFPIRNQSIVPCVVLTVLDLHTDFSGGRKVVWYSLLLKNFPQFAVIHIVKGFSVVNETQMFFWNLLTHAASRVDIKEAMLWEWIQSPPVFSSAKFYLIGCFSSSLCIFQFLP